MPGKPRSRARREAEAAAAAAATNPPAAPAGIPEAQPAGGAGDPPAPARAHAHDARTRTPAGTRARAYTGGRANPPRSSSSSSSSSAQRFDTHERPPTAAHALPVGPKLRAAVDDAQARTVAELGAHLHSAVTLRIERLSPVWCEGWCEDYPTEALESLGPLYEHLSAQWGGGRFKVTALGEGELILLVSKIAVSGKPRYRGREIERDRWEGRNDEERTRALVATPAGPDMGAAMVSMLTLMLEQQRTTGAQQLDSVRDMYRHSSETTSALLRQVMARLNGGNDRERRPFTEQLEEILQTTAALERARRVFGAGSASRRSERRTDEGNPMEGALRQALTNFMSNAFTPGGAAAPASSSTSPGVPAGLRPLRVVPQQAVGAETPTIPEAIPDSGQ